MMAWIAALAVSLASGWFLARALTAGAWPSAPRWASALVELSLAALFGPGLVSVLFFGLMVAGAGNRGAVLGMLALVLTLSAAAWWRFTPSAPPGPASQKRFPWIWALWICAAAGAVFLFLDFQAASSANPSGEWDAISIWNLRARYLASGDELWRRAMSAALGGRLGGAAHPGYPLFLSGFIGLAWNVAGAFDQTVPIAVSLMFAAGTLLLLGASVACRKSAALGLLAWCVLLASEVFASQAAAQYSDLLQGFAFLAAILLLDAAAGEHGGPRVLIAAGLAIGLTGWVKNEGLPFMIAAAAVAAWRFGRRGLPWLALGAAPGLLATVTLKLVAEGHEAILPPTLADAVGKIVGAGRWWQAALGFGKAIYEAGNPWTHPVILAAVLAFALGWAPAERRARWWLWIPLALTAAAEYGLYLVTTADLDWHISTSVSRLVAQLWPALIWMFFAMLRTPEEFFEAPAMEAAQGEKTGRRKTARR